jgi:hypothetical protein
MKTIFAIFFYAVSLAMAGSDYKYANTNGWYGNTLPDPMSMTNGQTIWQPTLRQYQGEGYRFVTIIDVPSQTNLTATSYNVNDLNGTNAELTVKTTYDWVAANAQVASNAAAFKWASVTNLQLTSWQMGQLILGSQTNVPAQYKITPAQLLLCASNIIYNGHY